MKFRFKKQSNGTIYAMDNNSTKRLATYAQDGDDWTRTLNDKLEFAEGVVEAMDAAFEAYLLKQESPEETPEPEESTTEAPASPAPPLPPVPAPLPDPIGGTGSIIYMLWAAEHATDEQFRELYGDRIAHKPSFLPWVQRTEALRPFQKRAEKLLTA